MIYRVTVRTTDSVQPSGTFWSRSVIYCGTSLEDARVEYLRSIATDHGGSYGNRSRDTAIEEFESEPEDIESVDADAVEVD